MENSTLVNIREVADMLRKGEGTVRYYVIQRRKGFSDFPLPISREKQKLFWRRSDIEQWLYGQQVQVADEQVNRNLKEQHGIDIT